MMAEISRHQKKPAGIAKGAGTVRNPMESETPLLPMQPKIMEKTAAVAGSKIVRSVNACAILRRFPTPGESLQTISKHCGDFLTKAESGACMSDAATAAIVPIRLPKPQ